MIQIRNLSKTIKRKKILTDINADLKGITGIIGPNGAGKTTLMKIIATVLNGDKNTEILYSHQNNTNVNIGYLPQQFNIYSELTVIDVLTLLAQLKKVFDEIYINYLLESLNLMDYKHQKMKELSGGTIQRVGIAQALLTKPDYLIIDEPTTALDIKETINLRNTLLNISKQDIEIVISSHIPEDITSICNHLIVIDQGKKIFEGTIDELANYPSYLTYEGIINKSQIPFINQVGIILNVEQLPKEKIRVKLITNQYIDNPVFEIVDKPDFISGYIALLEGRKING